MDWNAPPLSELKKWNSELLDIVKYDPNLQAILNLTR